MRNLPPLVPRNLFGSPSDLIFHFDDPMSLTTIAIADDHPIVIEMLKRLPQWEPDFLISHCCNSGEELFDALRRSAVDLIVVDYSMSRGDKPIDGLRLLRKLCDVAPSTQCVMLTAQKNPSIFAAALRLCVKAIVSKEDGIDEIVRACRHVRAGQTRYFSPTVRVIVEQSGASGGDTLPRLTRKELDVVRLFALGHSLASIAERLGRSVSTVSTQKYTAMKKLRADTNTDLIRYAYESGLI
ncbi:response regulator transcription factor [Burkholderia sp. Bp8998]|uniref:response regulator transcription factor n=1 Tax=Burkholderia sp. Bp8998 TaxID=2184557 RepID=UPI000F59D757|nr:response regulator transcription factor [Burkholderia sp. Bp8998]RQS12804.1 DNA-binding response regulator [Burkholderia sp. Bp8998]